MSPLKYLTAFSRSEPRAIASALAMKEITKDGSQASDSKIPWGLKRACSLDQEGV